MKYCRKCFPPKSKESFAVQVPKLKNYPSVYFVRILLSEFFESVNKIRTIEQLF